MGNLLVAHEHLSNHFGSVRYAFTINIQGDTGYTIRLQQGPKDVEQSARLAKIASRLALAELSQERAAAEQFSSH